MKKTLWMLFLLSLIARSYAADAPIIAAPGPDPQPDTAPSYFAKLAMVKMWPQGREPLPEDQVAAIKRGARTQAYTVTHNNAAGKLWTVEEIEAGKRKIKFAYAFDQTGEVIRIDMYFPDGKAKTYYDRYGKPPPAKRPRPAVAPTAAKPAN
ncbi:MAG: hypothetical protein JSS11_15530 [Verrucomicrobia bacterium]|nr:hypothetical protein [Verrucomicrobiota bacterium]